MQHDIPTTTKKEQSLNQSSIAQIKSQLEAHMRKSLNSSEPVNQSNNQSVGSKRVSSFKGMPASNVSDNQAKVIEQLKKVMNTKNQLNTPNSAVNNSMINKGKLHVRTSGYSETYHHEIVNNFLKLSLIYHAYQICLRECTHRLVSKRLEIENIPSELTVTNLNFGKDFYKYLPTIELFWPNAGKIIIAEEMKLMFILNKCHNPIILSSILKGTCAQFEADFDQYIKENPDLKDYIEKGNGLDIENHPWTKNHCGNLPQPKCAIEFFGKNIPEDITLQKAVKEIKQAVDVDGAYFDLTFARRR